MATNNFLPFSPTTTGTNLLTQSEYAAATDRDIGNQPGVASSKLNNKALRQATYVTSQLAQMIANFTGADVLDNNTPAQLLAQMNALLKPLAPIPTRLLSSQTFYLTYVFFVASANATIGATYTNNTFTFTVSATIAGGLQLSAVGTGVPSVSGVLTKTSGTGDATISFYATRLPLYANVKMAGSGGGGSGGGISAVDGSDGVDTTFGGGAFLTAGKGGKGLAGGSSSTAASANTIGAGIIIIQDTVGTPGAPCTVNSTSGASAGGGSGGQNSFGGAGRGGGPANAAGLSAIANTGGGGGGGGSTLTAAAGSGGSSGSFLEVQLNSLLTSYAAVIGAGGAAGTGAYAGSDGGSGVVLITLHYQ